MSLRSMPPSISTVSAIDVFDLGDRKSAEAVRRAAALSIEKIGGSVWVKYCIGVVVRTVGEFGFLGRYLRHTPNHGITEAMKAMDHITAYVGANVDGACKLQMAIIEKPINPRGFSLGKTPIPYFSQRNACYGSVTFEKNRFIICLYHSFEAIRPIPLSSSWITVALMKPILLNTGDG